MIFNINIYSKNLYNFFIFLSLFIFFFSTSKVQGKTFDINNIEISNSSLCVAAYRKKQEFYGAEININKFKCDRSEIYFQKGSKIKIENEL